MNLFTMRSLDYVKQEGHDFWYIDLEMRATSLLEMTPQLIPKQFRWINDMTGKRKICIFELNCPFLSVLKTVSMDTKYTLIVLLMTPFLRHWKTSNLTVDGSQITLGTRVFYN